MKNKPPKIRFSKNGEWRNEKFGNLITRVSITMDGKEFPMVEYEDVNAGFGTLNKDINSKMNTKRGTLFTENDILFGKLRPYLKNWLLSDFEGIAVGDWWVLRTLKPYDHRFIYALIQSEKFQYVANISTGTKMPRSDWKTVSTSNYLVPKKTEQTKIGNFFKELDELIELTQVSISNLEHMKKSFLNKIFNSYKNNNVVQKTLGSLVKIFGGFSFKSSDYDDNGEYKIITISNVKGKRYVNYEKCNKISIKDNEKYRDVILEKDDILISMTGNVGRVSLATGEKALLNQRVAKIVPHKTDLNFIYYSLLFNFEKEMIRKSQGGAQKNISNKDIASFKIFLPQDKEQEEIGCFFKQIDELIELENKELELLQEMKRGFLQKMFV